MWRCRLGGRRLVIKLILPSLPACLRGRSFPNVSVGCQLLRRRDHHVTPRRPNGALAPPTLCGAIAARANKQPGMKTFHLQVRGFGLRGATSATLAAMLAAIRRTAFNLQSDSLRKNSGKQTTALTVDEDEGLWETSKHVDQQATSLQPEDGKYSSTWFI